MWSAYSIMQYIFVPGILLGMGSANKRRHCYVTPPLIGLSHTYIDPCVLHWILRVIMMPTLLSLTTPTSVIMTTSGASSACFQCMAWWKQIPGPVGVIWHWHLWHEQCMQPSEHASTYQSHTAAMADLHHSMTQGYHSINGLVQDCVISSISWWHYLALTPLTWAITACQHIYQSHTAAMADIDHSMTQGYHSINGLVQDCVISRSQDAPSHRWMPQVCLH